MPELPEVETVRRGLEPVLLGRRIAHAEIRRPDLRWPLPERMSERLSGARVLALRRRSKYLLAELDRGETLLVHLGMSGRMTISLPEGAERRPGVFALGHPPQAPHDHVVLHMEDGARITYNDARRFGAMDLFATGQTHPLLAGLGPEPLGNAFHAEGLGRALAGRRTPVKTALLDQRIVAGLGNIYVCEALWHAGIHPARKAARIARPRIERLVAAIRDVLAQAIEAGGSSLRDHRQASGEMGYFQMSFKAYGREGAPCPRPGCTGTIRRITQGGRSTFYCTHCQR